MSIRDGAAEWRYTSVAREYVNGPGRQRSFEELFRQMFLENIKGGDKYIEIVR